MAKSSTRVKGVAEALKAVKRRVVKRRARKAESGTETRPEKAKAKPAKAKAKPAKAKAPVTAASKGPDGSIGDAPIETVSGGQGGPPLSLPIEKLSDKEMRVLRELNGSGSGARPTLSIAEMGAVCFKRQPKAKARSWVRNSLRRLVRADLVEKVERGQFRISEAGRKGLARVEAA